MTTVATLSVDLTANTRDFDSGMGAVSTKIDNFGTRVSTGFTNAGAKLTDFGASITALGLPFAGLVAAAVGSFSDSQKAIAQLDATLKSTGGKAGVTKDAALKLASSLQRVTTYSDEAVLSGENLLLTFTNIGSDVFDQATTAALDMSTAMGQDVKSSAIQLGKALNNPVEGLTALTRVGVTFSDEQKALIKSLQDSGDMAGAQTVILQELQKEFGGSAVAAGSTFAGSLEILKNKGDDALETLGGAMIPALTNLTGVVGGVIDAFTELSPEVQQTIANVALVGAGLAVVGPVIAAIGLGVTALGGAFAVLLSPIGLVVLALAGLGALVASGKIDLGGIADQIKAGAQGIGDSLNNLDVTNIETSVSTAFQGLDFANIGDIMQAHFNDILTAIVSVVGIVFGGPISIVLGIARLVGLAIEENFLGLGDFLKTSGISDTVTTAFNDLKTTIDDAIATVFGGAQAAQPPGSGLDITAGLTDAVKPEKLTPLQLFASDLQVGFDAIKKVAADVWDELKPGFDALGAGITGFVGAFADTDTEGLLRVVTGIAGAIGALIAPLIELGAQVAGDVLTNLGNALPQIGGFISNLVSAISDVGKGDFAGVATDLGQAAIDIGNAALNLFGIQITIPDFTAAIEGWRTGFDSIKTIVETITTLVITKITDFAGGIKNKLIDIAQAFLDFRITLANLVGDTATVASLQTSKADWESQRYVPQAGAMPGAATGASVMRTGAVLVHSGERILNKQETAAYSGGAASSIGQFIVNQTDTDTLLFDLKRRGIDLYMMAQGQGA